MAQLAHISKPFLRFHKNFLNSLNMTSNDMCYYRETMRKLGFDVQNKVVRARSKVSRGKAKA